MRSVGHATDFRSFWLKIVRLRITYNLNNRTDTISARGSVLPRNYRSVNAGRMSRAAYWILVLWVGGKNPGCSRPYRNKGIVGFRFEKLAHYNGGIIQINVASWFPPHRYHRKYTRIRVYKTFQNGSSDLKKKIISIIGIIFCFTETEITSFFLHCLRKCSPSVYLHGKRLNDSVEFLVNPSKRV